MPRFTLSKLLSELLAQVVALLQSGRLRRLDVLLALQHLILVRHQALEVLRSEQHEVVFVRIYLLAVNRVLTCN